MPQCWSEGEASQPGPFSRSCLLCYEDSARGTLEAVTLGRAYNQLDRLWVVPERGCRSRKNVEGMSSENLEDSAMKVAIISVTWKMKIIVFQNLDS